MRLLSALVNGDEVDVSYKVKKCRNREWSGNGGAIGRAMWIRDEELIGGGTRESKEGEDQRRRRDVDVTEGKRNETRGTRDRQAGVGEKSKRKKKNQGN